MRLLEGVGSGKSKAQSETIRRGFEPVSTVNAHWVKACSATRWRGEVGQAERASYGRADPAGRRREMESSLRRSWCGGGTGRKGRTEASEKRDQPHEHRRPGRVSGGGRAETTAS